jgi:DNA-damage-inducible protein D
MNQSYNNNLESRHRRLLEEIKQTNTNGIEYWSARDLQLVLGYKTWENFVGIIEKAKISLTNSELDISVSVAFRDSTKSYKGKNRFGEFTSEKHDYHLSRYACYLIAQNGDPMIPEIASAQSYFAIQTYRQEQMEDMSEEQKRLYIRSQVTLENKKLHKTAQDSGVYRFGKFNDAGYLGLYGLRAQSITEKKDLGKDKILDRAGSTELAANLFRITQTQEKLQKEIDTGQRIGESAATHTHFMVGGKVRQTIKDIGGTMPEDLPPAEDIKKLKRRFDAQDKQIASGKQKTPEIE